MKLTNKFNLPQSIVNAVANDPYDNKGTLSVTTLLKPPYMVALEKEHRDDIVEDVSDRVYSLLGQSIHHILERAGSDLDLVEERFFTEINGERVSGQLDLLEADGTLCDFKVTSVWAILAAMKEGKSEWEEQLNMLAYLAKQDGHTVKKLRIVAIARDWSPSKAKQGGSSYPQRVEAIEFPLWEEAEQYNFLASRVYDHQFNTGMPCMPSERWCKPSKWAVHREGRGRALRLLESPSEAQEWCKEKDYVGGEGGITVQERVGENIRCESYCSVRDFCPYYENNIKVKVSPPTLRKL